MTLEQLLDLIAEEVGLHSKGLPWRAILVEWPDGAFVRYDPQEGKLYLGFDEAVKRADWPVRDD